MNHHNSLSQLITILMAVLCFIPIAAAIAYASTHAMVEDLSIDQADLSKSYLLYEKLKADGLVKDKVAFDDFDYIYTLSYQLADMTEHVPHSLVLAMIAYESNFDRDAESSAGAVGLMQVTPLYHHDRMVYFVEEGHEPYVDDFFDPRLNMACGIDYMEELLKSTDDNTTYSLMCYNQGVTSATKTYYNKGASNYARNIIALSQEIEEFLQT